MDTPDELGEFPEDTIEAMFEGFEGDIQETDYEEQDIPESQMATGISQTDSGIDSIETADASQIGAIDNSDTGSNKKRRKYCPPPRCSHGRIKYECKECGGSKICSHNRIKYTCKQCRIEKEELKELGLDHILKSKIPTRIKPCRHGLQKVDCKDCKGRVKCPHDKKKNQCKECNGSSLCLHNKIKWDCKQCNGRRICEHGRFKPYCKDCGGSSLCLHGRTKTKCVDCGGYNICAHGRNKYNCKECKVPAKKLDGLDQDQADGGSSSVGTKKLDGLDQDQAAGGSSSVGTTKARRQYPKCPHGVTRHFCVQCEKASPCIHGTPKSLCPECYDIFICPHDKIRTQCKTCNKAPKSSIGGN